MVNIKKYDASKEFKTLAPKLIADVMKGYSAKELCIKYGIGESTLYRWKTLNAKFNKSYKDAERYSARSLIKSGLNEMAKGHEVIEEVTEFYDTHVDDHGTEHKVKRTIRSRKLPPDIKAIRMLAAKHAQGEYLEEEANKNGININVITQKDRALSIEERKAILLADKAEGEGDIEVEYKEVLEG